MTAAPAHDPAAAAVPPLLVTFTGLYPSSAFPTHGLFVRERMRRVAAALGCEWVVVAPVPLAPWGLRRGDYRRQAALPAEERLDGVRVLHPRYRHWPGLSTRAQARNVAAAARAVVAQLVGGRRCVLDAHYVWPDGVAALYLARELGVPCVVTARGSDVNVLARVPAIRRQIAAAARDAFALLAVSDALARAFADAASLPRGAVRVARNGVDLERFAPGDARAARTRLGLPHGVPLVLPVGGRVAAMGFGDAAAALRDVPGAELVLVGDGPKRRTLEAAAPGRVRVLGARPPHEVALAYQACDALVLPSWREGWPNVVTEALASGLAVVATPVGGVPQILDGAPGARLVAVGQVGALAVALREVLAAPPRRDEVRAFAARWSWDEPVAMLCGLMRDAWTRGGASAGVGGGAGSRGPACVREGA